MTRPTASLRRSFIRRSGAATPLLCVAALIIAPGMARADHAHPVVGFSLQNVDAFSSSAYDGAKKVVEAAGGRLLWVSAQDSASKQATDLSGFVSQKVDVIVVAEIRPELLTAPLAAANRAGIPVVAVNQSLSPEQRRSVTAYVGADDVEAGREEARCVIKALPPGHNAVVVLRGTEGDAPTRDRSAGIDEVLAQHPEIQRLATTSARFNRTLGFNRMEDWENQFGNRIDGVIAENDSMAEGAVQALEEHDLDGRIPVCSIDGTAGGMTLVRAHAITGTMLQNGLIQYGEAIQVGLDAMARRPHPTLALIKLPEVSSENVDSVMSQLVDNRTAFIEHLPGLIRSNLDSGDYGKQ